MKKFTCILIVIVVIIFSCEEEPTIKESLDYIKSELDGHSFNVGISAEIKIQDVSFKILDYERCECEYTYTYVIKGRSDFKQSQKFNLLDASSSYKTPQKILINLSNKSNKRTVTPIDSKVNVYEVVKIDEVSFYTRREQNDRIFKAIKLCNKKIQKNYFD